MIALTIVCALLLAAALFFIYAAVVNTESDISASASNIAIALCALAATLKYVFGAL